MDRAEYEPEQFPGLIYRLKLGTALVFSSGKVIITGVKSIREAEESYLQLKSDLKIM